MHDLPPKQEKIVFVKQYRQEQEVFLKRDLWREMEFQMQLTGMTLEQFVAKALQFFIDDLKIEQDNEARYLDFSEYQLFPTVHSNPIPIHPFPSWANQSLEKSIDAEEMPLVPKSPKKKRHSSGAKDKKKSDHV